MVINSENPEFAVQIYALGVSSFLLSDLFQMAVSLGVIGDNLVCSFTYVLQKI